MGGTRREPLYRVPIWQRTPPVGAYLLIPEASYVELRARAFLAQEVTARIAGVHGSVVVEGAPDFSSIAVKVPVARLDTGFAWRDAQVRGPSFLDVEQHPEILYEGDCVQPLGKGTYAVHGEMTVRGIREPAVLTAELNDIWEGTDGTLHARVTGQTTIEREAFGVPRSESLALWGFLASRLVEVRFEIELVTMSNSSTSDRAGQPRWSSGT